MQMFETQDTPKTAEQIFARLTRMEKIDLRRSSDGRIEHLAREKYVADGATAETLMVVRDRVIADFHAFESDVHWSGTGSLGV